MHNYVGEIKLPREEFKRVYEFQAHSREHAIEVLEEKLPVEDRLRKHHSIVRRGPGPSDD